MSKNDLGDLIKFFIFSACGILYGIYLVSWAYPENFGHF
jgi:hypothetical protein